MPFFRPSVAQIRKRRIADYEYELGSQSARLQGTVEHALATSGSGAAHGLHGHLDDVSKNAFPHLADDERLRQWASFFGVYQLEAVRSEGYGLFSPSTNIDTLLPEETVVTRADGLEYEVISDTVIVGANLVTGALLRARVAGAAGDLVAGSALTLATPIAGIASAAVSSGITGGLDEESSASLRTRLLARLDQPPKGGGPGDYVGWAKRVPGVTRAWEYRWAPKVGYVTVLFMRDLDADPFPDAGEVAQVQDELEKHAPIVAPPPIAKAPTKLPIFPFIELAIESGFDLATVRANVYKAIRDMLAVRFAPLAVDGVLFRSWITEAISSAPGELDHKLIDPVADLPVGAWQLPVLEDGGITWM